MVGQQSKVFVSPNIDAEPDFDLPARFYLKQDMDCVYNAFVRREFSWVYTTENIGDQNEDLKICSYRKKTVKPLRNTSVSLNIERRISAEDWLVNTLPEYQLKKLKIYSDMKHFVQLSIFFY